MAELPVLDVEQFIRAAGARRVSEDAGKTLTHLLEDEASEIIEKAMLFARHANRKTITPEDIMLAVECVDCRQ